MEVKPGYKQTELGVIPEGWDVRKLPDLSWFQEGPGLRNWQFTASGMKVINVTNLENGVLNLDRTDRHISLDEFNRTYRHFEVEDADIVMASSGNSYSKTAIVRPQDLPLVMNTSVIRFRPAKGCDYGFLWALLNSPQFKQQIDLMITGGAQPNFGPYHLKRICVPFPPLPEQRAIAEALSDVDGLLGGLDRLIAKKRDLKQAAMQQLLTGQTRLPGFHGEWEVKQLGRVLRFQVGFPFSSAFFNEKGQGIRLIKNRDLKCDDQVFYYSGAYDSAYLVKDGDVLVGMDGDFLPCLWSKGTALLNQRVGRIVPTVGLNLQFVYYYLLEPLKEIEIATASTTVKHLSHGDIESIEQPLPSLPEQTAIAEGLTAMDAELTALEQRREKTRALKQAMMQELLTGRTRLV